MRTWTETEPGASLGSWAERFRALGDPSRLRIVAWIARSGELCAKDFEGPLALGQPTVSHHLATLRRAGVLQAERRGAWVYFRLDPELPLPLRNLISSLVEEVPVQPTFFGPG